MKHTPINLVWFLALCLVASLLTGCSSIPPRQEIPTAVVYDRALDVFRVEVEAVAEGEEPEYPDTLAFFTLIDGQRREGLIPPAQYRVLGDRGQLPFWRGPTLVEYAEGEWSVARWEMAVYSRTLVDLDLPIEAWIRTDPKLMNHSYRVTVQGAGFRID